MIWKRSFKSKRVPKSNLASRGRSNLGIRGWRGRDALVAFLGLSLVACASAASPRDVPAATTKEAKQMLKPAWWAGDDFAWVRGANYVFSFAVNSLLTPAVASRAGMSPPRPARIPSSHRGGGHRLHSSTGQYPSAVNSATLPTPLARIHASASAREPKSCASTASGVDIV